MQRTRDRKKGVDLSKPVERPRMPIGIFVRIFVFGSLAIIASAYAIWRHVMVPRPSMIMATPPEETVVPAPDLVPLSPEDSRDP